MAETTSTVKMGKRKMTPMVRTTWAPKTATLVKSILPTLEKKKYRLLNLKLLELDKKKRHQKKRSEGSINEASGVASRRSKAPLKIRMIQ